jgi:hypothetical protein
VVEPKDTAAAGGKQEGKRTWKLSQEDRELIRDMYLQGGTAASIATALGVSETGIFYVLRQMEVPRRKRRYHDLAGRRFGRWTVESAAESDGKSLRWNCRCDCGNVGLVWSSSLKSGESQSCGCLRRELQKPEDVTGKRFGRLTSLRFIERRRGTAHWLCRCDCGNLATVCISSLKDGTTKSCGCYQRDRASEIGKGRPKNPEGRMTSVRLRRHRKAQGLCPGCAGQPAEGYVSCAECLLKGRPAHRRHQAKRNSERIRGNLCRSCGGVKEDGFASCLSCRQRQRLANKRHHDAMVGRGGCSACRKEGTEPGTVCPSCRATYLNLKKERISRGLCFRCGNVAFTGKKHPLCRTCWFKGKAASHTGTARNWKEIEALWEQQGGKCAYTGLPLIPGENAALDHVLPKSKGGWNHVVNLQWTRKEVNLMKNDLSHSEFLAFCHLIVSRFPTQ